MTSPAAPSDRPDAEQRILSAVTALLARDGYAQLTVQRVLEQAGVSRATFYQYYESVDDAFSSAYRLHAEDLSRTVASAAEGAEHPQWMLLETLIDLAESRPSVATVLLGECMAAGPIGLRERDLLISALEAALAGAGDRPRTIDLPPNVLIGAMFRFVAANLPDGTPTRARDEIRAWASSFERPACEASWSSTPTPRPPEQLSSSLAHSTPLGDGSSYERILQATAAVIHRHGYHASSVADIVTVARVSRRSFYNAFPSREAAFRAAYELGFEQTMAACAPAFFSAEEWPERVWRSALAFTRYFAAHPSFAYLGFVECHALGRDFAQRVNETQLAFTLFLEEGYRQSADTEGMPVRICSALTSAAIAESGFLASRRSPGLYIRSMQPLAVYIALTPFIGCELAREFVAGKLASRPTLADPDA